MKYFILLLVWAAFSAQTVIAEDGLVHVKSAHDVKTTADRLEKVLEAKGMTLFNRINHAAGAKSVGRQLRPTELVIFGNPKVGSPLMACQQTVGIDLPQKALIWQDKSGQSWFSYNRPAYLKNRHQIEGCDEVIAKVSKALENFAKAATRP
jgi:uncharacterized protein (DUF302 family)